MGQSKIIQRMGLVLFSIFLLWHAIGISVVGPSHKSYMRNGLMYIYEDYLALFHLDQQWLFYAPNPFFGSILQYETIDSSGRKTTYPLTNIRNKFDHTYFRYTNFYAYLFSDFRYTKKRGYDKSVARYLCAQHKDSDIKRINFILQYQKRFTYIDFRSGMRPLDKQFLTKAVLGPYQCIG